MGAYSYRPVKIKNEITYPPGRFRKHTVSRHIQLKVTERATVLKMELGNTTENENGEGEMHH